MTLMMADSVPTLDEITALEEPGDLLASRRALDARWDAGHRDVETVRRRAFLYWWSCAEPEFLTGLPEDSDTSPFAEMRDLLMNQSAIDPETRFTLGWMMSSFAWCCGPEPDLEERGRMLLRDHDSDPSGAFVAFDRRSEYGRYFGHILASRGDAQSRP